MAHTVSSSNPLSFAISYGLVGGPAHSRKLRKMLHQASFFPAKLAKADVIITHSAGCWLIPENARPKLVVYVGMPLATASPRHTWLYSNIASFTRGHVIDNLNVRLKNTYYGIRQPRRNLNIIRDAKIGQPVLVAAGQTVFIANHYDPWPKSDNLETYITGYPWAFISMSGTHDNIWEQPERYVAIINHYAGLLAQTDG